jgi:hypothetical protein
MRILFSLLLISLFAGSRCGSQAKRQDPSQAWIERLKGTPVSQMEAGLPETSFAAWFANVVKPSEAGYEVSECQGTNGPDASANQERLLCVLAYTKPPQPGWNRGVQLSFVVGVLPASKNETEAKPVPCRFLGGWEGPSNPSMKRPNRGISKLSDLERMLHGTAMPPNS